MPENPDLSRGHLVGEEVTELSPASEPAPPKLHPNRIEEDQEMEMEPIVLGPAPYSSPDPETDGQRMLPLEQGTSAASAADEAAKARAATQSYKDMEPDALKSLAEERDLTVTRTDGKKVEGNIRLRKEDYVAALTEDDTKDMKASDWKEAISAATTMEELEDIGDRYDASGAEYSTVDDAFDKRADEIQNAEEPAAEGSEEGASASESNDSENS